MSRSASATEIQNRRGSRSLPGTDTQAARSASPAAPIQDRSKNVLPLPAGADTWVTRAACPEPREQPVADDHPAAEDGDSSGDGVSGLDVDSRSHDAL